MNTSDLLEKGYLLVLQAVDDLPEAQWDLPGACGNWSIKETVAHLASYEQVLITVLLAVQQEQEPATDISQILKNPDAFNKQEVEKRQYQTAQHVLDEYNDAQLQASSLLSQITPEKLVQGGTISLLRPDKNLADLLKSFSEHTSRHAQQIIHFRKQQG